MPEGACPVCAGECTKRFSARSGEPGTCYGSRRIGIRNAHGDIHVCRRCGWGVVYPLPSPRQLATYYRQSREESYLLDSASRSLMFRRELDTVTALLGRTPTSVLDVGCSYGLVLKEARRRGIPALGLELSTDAVSHCRREGLSVRQGGPEMLDTDERFDVVFMWDVIEHLIDPVTSLSAVRHHMSQGGVITVVVPDRGSLLARLLGERWWSICQLHLHYPTARGLNRLLHTLGFAVAHQTTLPKIASLSQLVRWLPGRAPKDIAQRSLVGKLTVTLNPHDQLLVRAHAADMT